MSPPSTTFPTSSLSSSPWRAQAKQDYELESQFFLGLVCETKEVYKNGPANECITMRPLDR
jgi:hypothetical protein